MVQANATNTNTNTSGAGRRLASFPPWGDGEGWPENWTAPWSSSGDAGAAPTTSWDVTNWLPTEMQETYAEWLSTAGDMVDEMQHEGSISFPAAQKLQDIQYKMELIESAEHPEEVFYALVQDAIQEVCDPAAIIVGALVGVEDFQDDVRGDPDKVHLHLTSPDLHPDPDLHLHLHLHPLPLPLPLPHRHAPGVTCRSEWVHPSATITRTECSTTASSRT